MRDGAPVTHGSYGTLSFRRRIRNTSGARITQLRFRIVDITTKGSPGEGLGQADLRAVDSTDAVVTTSNGVVTVRGTLVGLPPSQLIGGGMNSTLLVTLPGSALDPDATLDVQLLLGVEQGGSFRFFVNTEAVTATAPGLSSQKARGMKSLGGRKGK